MAAAGNAQQNGAHDDPDEELVPRSGCITYHGSVSCLPVLYKELLLVQGMCPQP